MSLSCVAVLVFATGHLLAAYGVRVLLDSQPTAYRAHATQPTVPSAKRSQSAPGVCSRSARVGGSGAALYTPRWSCRSARANGLDAACPRLGAEACPRVQGRDAGQEGRKASRTPPCENRNARNLDRLAKPEAGAASRSGEDAPMEDQAVEKAEAAPEAGAARGGQWHCSEPNSASSSRRSSTLSAAVTITR